MIISYKKKVIINQFLERINHERIEGGVWICGSAARAYVLNTNFNDIG